MATALWGTPVTLTPHPPPPPPPRPYPCPQKRAKRLAESLRARHGQRLQQCVGAFVVFRHRESLRRCLADYAPSERWYRRLCQPLPLRFRRKHRLQVEKAAEPSNVLWENLGTCA